MSSQVAVIGPGAIGGLLAFSLHRAGFQVRLVGRARGANSRLRREGLAVTGLDGRTRRWRPSPPPRGPQAAVFLCVKSAGLRGALRAARALAGPETAVVSLLNGVTHVGPVLAAAGPSRAVFGANYIASMRTARARIRHFGGRRIVLARTPDNARALNAARSALRAAGWEVSISPFPDRLLWTKLVFNAAANPLGALTRRSNAELAKNPALRELLVAITREGDRIARASGHPPVYSDMERRIIQGCLSGKDQQNSMSQDLDAGRTTEADAILKPLLDAARRTRAKVPLLRCLYAMVKRLEADLKG